MTSAGPNASTPNRKSLNTFSSHSTLQQQQQTQITHPGFQSSSRRTSNHSNPIYGSTRSNQSHKKHHKSSRKPKLADEDTMAEPGSTRNVNSRKGQTSITHLMNITLPPRPQDYRNSVTRGTRRGNIYGIGSGHHFSDKARYIHANYRFLVKPNNEYKKQAVNADQHLDWNDVLQILASAESQAASCPICLSHPVAPRMAKCGHIFCLPCLIRYMHSVDDINPLPEKKARWKKCPICWDSVFISDTRPVRWYRGQEGPTPREGDDVVLRLVMRQPGSTLALPRDGADTLSITDDVPWYFAAEVTDYARIMKGSEKYMIEQFDREIEELQLQEKEDQLMFGEEPEWTRKAVNAVKEAKERIIGIGNPPPMPKQPMEILPKRQPIQFNKIDHEAEASEIYYVRYTSKTGLAFPEASQSSQNIETGQANHSIAASSPQELDYRNDQVSGPAQFITKPARSRLNEAHHRDAPYFFYQALLHYYLAPLDIRILKSAFGNFASFPSTLLPRVERVSTGHIMDDELRKRIKYLAHLPYGCEVGFLECNWTDVVGPDILDQFKEEIETRRKRNREKQTREEKDRVCAEKAEDDARWANIKQKHPSIPQRDSLDDFHPLAPSSLDATSASPKWPAREGSSIASLTSPSTSPLAPKTVWGTTLVASISPELHPQQAEYEADDGWLQSWEQELVAENELIEHVQVASLNDVNGANALPSAAHGKKKKAKKITLMSTTARRAA